MDAGGHGSQGESDLSTRIAQLRDRRYPSKKKSAIRKQVTQERLDNENRHNQETGDTAAG